MTDTTHLLRQLDIIPLAVLTQPITVIGCGAIGSFTILSLAKMGFTNIVAYDFDEVGLENMNCQFYRRKDVGAKKADALKALVYDFTGEWINAKPERWNGQQLAGIVITAVDSMSVRQEIWNKAKGNSSVSWYIDPRMSAEQALSYVVNPHDEKDIVSYEKSLYSDESAVQERCTAKATMYTATMIAGYVAKHVKDLVLKEPYARITQWNIKDNTLVNWGKQYEGILENTLHDHGTDRVHDLPSTGYLATRGAEAEYLETYETRTPDADGVRAKQYVIWNKKNFTRQPGATANGTMSVSVLSAMGAKNIKQLEGINGTSFEGESAAAALKAQAQNGDWVIQEEIEHHVLAFSCSRCETIPCPGGPVDPVPKCPSPPGTGPCPIDPGPIEPDKSWGRTRVHAKAAMELGTADTSQVKVCVVDTGIDLNHPNNGVIIGKIGYAGAVQDGAGHGTHTAGTVSGTGGVGISRAKLLICKGLSDSGSGSSSGLAQCLAWCGANGAQIVSNSWGSTQSDGLINQAITALTQRGIYVFVAAGNDSGPVNWPAKLAGSNVLVYAIAASDQSDRITGFSSRGPEIRYISPGAGIISNWPGGGTRALDGTSMATPHAAAICAFGIARGRRPCVNTSGTVAAYPFADALASAQ